MRAVRTNVIVLRALVLGILAAAAFCTAFAMGARGKPLQDHIDGWRPWDDLAIASTYVRDGGFPVGPYVIGNSHRRASPEFRAFRQPIMKTFRSRPVEDLWASVDTSTLVAVRSFPVTRVDDTGRAFFLGLLFRLTGAVRPLFIVWLPVGFVALMLGWVVFELSLQGRLVASVVMTALAGGSSFFREGAAIGYAAYGFYFAAAFALIAFSVAMSARALIGRATARAMVAALALCVAVPSRSAALLMAPAFVIAWTWRFWDGPSWTRRIGALAVAIVLFIAAPRLTLIAIDRYSAHTLAATDRKTYPSPGVGGHDAWPTLWIGLGDFDRTKGHQYLDEAAKRVALAGGFHDRIDASAEAYFRDIIVWEIARDPLWFVDILARRMHASFFLAKLAPRASESGSSFAPSTHPNEGAFDSYIGLLPTADRFGWGRLATEIPSALLWMGWPLLILLRLTKWAGESAPRAGRALVPALLGLLASPVIVTTASAIEMEAVTAVHLIAWALAIDGLVQGLWRRRSQGSTTTSAEIA